MAEAFDRPRTYKVASEAAASFSNVESPIPEVAPTNTATTDGLDALNAAFEARTSLMATMVVFRFRVVFDSECI